MAACSPTEYRKSGYQPVIVTVDELIIKFTNRLKGGTLIYPKLIKHEKLILAGIQGAGNKTGEVWQNFLKLYKEKPLSNLLSEDGYEIRMYHGEECSIFVGSPVTDKTVDPAYLPPFAHVFCA